MHRIYLKKQFLNCLIFNGKKATVEKVLLKTVKRLGQTVKVHTKNVIKSYFFLLFPIFKINIAGKRNSSVIIWNQKIRVSSVVKQLVSTLKNKKPNYLYIKLYKEILEINDTGSKQLEAKNKTQKQILSTKNFFFFYKWS